MESFGLPKSNRWEKTLRALTLVAAVTPSEAPAEAIPEIDGKAWYEGVDMLRDSALGDNHEVGALYIRGGKHEGQWATKGKAGFFEQGMTVTTSSREIREKVAAYEQANGLPEIVCTIHTHPLSAVPAEVPRDVVKDLSAAGKLFFPPSVGDQDGLYYEQFHQDVGYKMTDAVFTANGVWYYRQATEEDYNDFPVANRLHIEKIESDNRLFGHDGELGVLQQRLQELDVSDLQQLKSSVGADEDVFHESLAQSIKSRLERTTELEDKLFVSLRGLFPDLLPDLLGVVKEKVFGQRMFDYSNFYGVYGQLPPEYDSTVSEMLGRMLPDGKVETFRGDQYSVYNEFKGEMSDGTVSTLADDVATHVIEDMLISGKVRGRFVTYDQLQEEPPCAGVDYVPEK